MPPSFTFKPMSGTQIESIATSVILSYQPEVLKGSIPFDVHRFVDIRLEDITGIEPVYSDELPPEIFGITDSAEKKMIIQAEIAEDPLNEKFFRSTLAHETGHCFLHVTQLQGIDKVQIFKQGKGEGIHLYRKNDAIPLYCNPEWQAWRFAGALLVPETPLKKMIADGICLTEIAEVFNVNMAFLRSRLKALKLMK